MNFSHIIVIGLGCEVNQLAGLLEEQKLADRVRSMDIQTMGGIRKTVEAGIAFVREVLDEANQVHRAPASLSELTVALQCGGSDGYSGISANPALGAASDLIVAHGGAVILSETPETYGAEHLLTRRAASPDVADKLVALMRWWERYTEREDAEMNANPSPGNKAGGLTTILEKSLGAMGQSRHHQPHRRSPLRRSRHRARFPVHGYARLRPGCRDWPGRRRRPTSSASPPAAAACSAANPRPASSSPPTPPCTERMVDDMDINCGTILDGAETVQECGARILDSIVATASGLKTKSEHFDAGTAEFAPWIIGATM